MSNITLQNVYYEVHVLFVLTYKHIGWMPSEIIFLKVTKIKPSVTGLNLRRADKTLGEIQES